MTGTEYEPFATWLTESRAQLVRYDVDRSGAFCRLELENAMSDFLDSVDWADDGLSLPYRSPSALSRSNSPTASPNNSPPRRRAKSQSPTRSRGSQSSQSHRSRTPNGRVDTLIGTVSTSKCGRRIGLQSAASSRIKAQQRNKSRKPSKGKQHLHFY